MRAPLDTSVVLAADVEPLESELAISAATLSELQQRFDAPTVDDAV